MNSEEDIDPADEQNTEESSTKTEKIVNGENKQPKRMFEFRIVNSNGSSEMGKLKDDGKPIKFGSRCHKYKNL